MKADTLNPVKYRIASIDLLRGLIMLIMAIDHTRDYFHLGQPDATNLATTTPILFFTRWITHFCAPAFVFLSGISAYLAGTRRSKSELSGFLIKRGLWLVAVEIIVITFAGTLDPLYRLVILQVIWAIGGSMILLGLLVWAPLRVIGMVGAILFFGHNLLDVVNVGSIGQTIGWKLLLSANGFTHAVPVGQNRQLLIAYALLPWTGVMLLGYVFGSLYKSTVAAARRKKVLLLTAGGLLLLFIILRAGNIYGDPAPWSVQRTAALTVISFLNVTKYPCSLVYLCMTLSPALVILALTENSQGWLARIFIVYGNVPFFYYVIHWYLIRLFNIALFVSQGFKFSDLVASFDPPRAYGISLGGVYLVWLLVISSLYWPCRWYSRYKKTHGQWWLSYL